MAGLSGFRVLLQTPSDLTIAVQAAVPAASDFQTVGGFQTNSLEISADAIDITNKSSGENMQILDKRGLLSITSSGSGILLDNAVSRTIEASALSQTLRWYRLIREDDGRAFIAKFKLSDYSFSSPHDGAVSFSTTFMSSGGIYVQGPGTFRYDTVSDRITAFSNAAATLSYRHTKSADYAFASIPAVADRKAAIETTLTAADLTLIPAAADAVPADVLTLAGSTVVDMFAFPVLFVRKSDLFNAQGARIRQLQVLDSLDQVIHPQPLQDYTIQTVEYLAYYFAPPLTMGENLEVKIQAG